MPSRTQKLIKDYDRYVLPTYTRQPVVVVKGKGSWIWDAEGKKYLDFFPGWGVSGLGHCHPKVVKAIRTQAAKLLHMPNNYYNEWQGRLAKVISEKAFPGKCFFCNSGAEANEGAIKLARRFGHKTGRYEIITMESSFHGRTLATITATGQKKYQQGFEPLVPGFKHVPFNDPATLKQALNPKTAAVMLELVQGEGGINVARPDYVQAIRGICDRERILMIIDEVQTGLGRTGNYFAFQGYGIQPEVMTLAKSLGGGVAIGAFIVQDKYADLLPAGSHASTFGGNPLACAAAVAVLEAIEEGSLLDNVKEMGDYLRFSLKALADEFPLIKEIRGMGIMLGLELAQPGQLVVEKCLSQGLIINCTAERVLRLMPALNVTRPEIDQAIGILRKVLAEISRAPESGGPG